MNDRQVGDEDSSCTMQCDAMSLLSNSWFHYLHWYSRPPSFPFSDSDSLCSAFLLININFKSGINASVQCHWKTPSSCNLVTCSHFLRIARFLFPFDVLGLINISDFTLMCAQALRLIWGCFINISKTKDHTQRITIRRSKGKLYINLCHGTRCSLIF